MGPGLSLVAGRGDIIKQGLLCNLKGPASSKTLKVTRVSTLSKHIMRVAAYPAGLPFLGFALRRRRRPLSTIRTAVTGNAVWRRLVVVVNVVSIGRRNVAVAIGTQRDQDAAPVGVPQQVAHWRRHGPRQL
jgi:hypothetical protein